jgi:hypothetical protein
MLSHFRRLSDYLSWMNFLEAGHFDCKDGFRHASCRVAAVCMVTLPSSRVTQNKRNCMFSKKQQLLKYYFLPKQQVAAFKRKLERLKEQAGRKQSQEEGFSKLEVRIVQAGDS